MAASKAASRAFHPGATAAGAPGVAAGTFDPEKYEFLNFGVAEVSKDLNLFLKKLRLVNSKSRIILTVSPIPLVATGEDRHVLVSTTYSKAVLRVAAEELARGSENVYYFPSFEIITGSHSRGAYFADDMRGVTEEGVDHVMRVFLSRIAGQALEQHSDPHGGDELQRSQSLVKAALQAACDEEVLSRSNS